MNRIRGVFWVAKQDIILLYEHKRDCRTGGIGVHFWNAPHVDDSMRTSGKYVKVFVTIEGA